MDGGQATPGLESTRLVERRIVALCGSHRLRWPRLVNKRLAALANLAFSSGNALLTLVAGLLLVPLYLRHFDMATYGAWLASGSVIAAIGLFESGLSTVLTRRLAAAHAAADSAQFAHLATSGILLAVFFGGFAALLGCALAPFAPAWVHAPLAQRAALTHAMQLCSFAAGGSILYLSIGAIPQAWQQTIIANLIGTLAFLMNVVVIVLGLHLGWGVVALGAGRLALALTQIGGYAWYLWIQWGQKSLAWPRPSVRLVREVWSEASNLLLSQIANTISGNLESFVAAALIAPEAAAVISLTGRVVSTVRMFLERIGSAVFAGMVILGEGLDRSSYHRVLVEFFTISASLAGLGLGCALAFSSSIIPLWVGPTAFGGIWLLALIAAGDALGFRKGLFVTLVIAGGRTRAAARISIVEALVRPVLLLGAAVGLGLLGIPLATLLANLVPVVLLSHVLRAQSGVSLTTQWLPGIKTFMCGLVAGVVALELMPPLHSWPSLGIAFFGFASLLLTLTLAIDRGWRTTARANVGLLHRRRLATAGEAP
ncbi:MAG: hypothetical protein EXR92_03810 [Gemmatimonadetes bacterium]|nr:hypothetical protein [Gemmatimonadota bacterium]